MTEQPKTESLLVLDIGKKKPKQIKKLKRGEGPLAEEVAQAVESAKARQGNGITGQQIIPVVILYRKPPKSAKGFF